MVLWTRIAYVPHACRTASRTVCSLSCRATARHLDAYLGYSHVIPVNVSFVVAQAMLNKYDDDDDDEIELSKSYHCVCIDQRRQILCNMMYLLNTLLELKYI